VHVRSCLCPPVQRVCSHLELRATAAAAIVQQRPLHALLVVLHRSKSPL
jgi:hypothetical protein